MPKKKYNSYKPISVTCDRCSKEAHDKILWRDKYGYYFCTKCYEDHFGTPLTNIDPYVPN